MPSNRVMVVRVEKNGNRVRSPFDNKNFLAVNVEQRRPQGQLLEQELCEVG
jgi:hypothetical protein